MSNPSSLRSTASARNIIAGIFICLFIGLRFVSFYFRHAPELNPAGDFTSPSKPFLIEAACPANRFPNQLNLIRKGMKYRDLASVLKLGLPKEAEEKIDGKRFVNIWYENETKGTVEVRLYAGRVLDARFLSDDELARG